MIQSVSLDDGSKVEIVSDLLSEDITVEVHPEQAYFEMTPTEARALVAALIRAADYIEEDS